MEKAIENLMNELAGMWIDTLGFDKGVQEGMTESMDKLCPGVIWVWERERIRVLLVLTVQL